MESNWRANYWRLNFNPSPFVMVARLVPPDPFPGAYIVQTLTTGQPVMVTASPTTLPVFIGFTIRMTPNFPYGHPVEPD